MEQRAAWTGRPIVALFALTDGGARIIEFEAPRQCGGSPIEFLVEPIA